jgi:hypothetical protein
MKPQKQCNLLLAAALVGMIAACSANAALSQLQITDDTTYTGTITGGGANNRNVFLTAFLARQIGGDPLPSGTSNPFYTFCLDPAPTLIPSDWWKSETFANAGAGNTVPYQPGGIQRAASLYNAYVGGVSFSTVAGKRQGAALQLAIWNVLFDSNPKVLGGGTGFQVAGANSAVTTLANQMLASAFNFANPNLTSTFWDATDANGNPIFNQDLIGPQTAVVPEPGTYGAMASAVGYLCVLGLRRKPKPS